MKEELLARIIGHLQFDGAVPKNRHARTLFYGNSNKDLIDEFVSDIMDVFGLRSSITLDDKLYRVYCYSTKIVRKLNEITNYHSYTWFVPDFILNGSEKIKIFYLQAFFDDEDYISATHKGYVYIVIRGVSVNLNGINSIKILLDSLGIESNVRKFQSGKTSFSKTGFQYVLTITNFNNVSKFAKMIKLTSKKKQSRIDNFIKNHGQNVMRSESEIQKVLEMKKRRVWS